MDVSKFMEWRKEAKKLKKAKKKEKELRIELTDMIFEGGNHKFELPTDDGLFEIKATPKVKNSVDEAVLTTIWPDLSQKEKDAISKKPKVVKGAFNKLDDDCKLMEAIVTAPGLASLKMERIAEED